MLIIASGLTIPAQTTTFTYQGRFTDAAVSQPTGGTYDFRFTLYDSAGIAVGTPVVRDDVAVDNGTFTVTLDFGAAFDGTARTLEIGVRAGTSTGAFTNLSPRQPITSAPYAIQALNAANAINATNAATATSAENLTGGLSGDVSGTQTATIVATVGGKTAEQISASVNETTNATNANAANTIVKRDSLGGFNAGSLAATDKTLFVAGDNGANEVLRVTSNYSDTANNGGLLARFRSAGFGPAADRFRFDNSGGFIAIGSIGYGTIPTSGGGWRMMWYPYKAAFRVGGIEADQWNDANIGFYSIAAGYNTTASSTGSFAGGWETTASGSFSTAFGYLSRAGGTYSVALGSRAHTGCNNGETSCSTALAYNGVFVFSDNSSVNYFNGTANNQFNVRAAGGYRLFSNSSLTSGVTLSAGGGSWTSVSDRNAKENFGAVDSRDILRKVLNLPISTWSYKGQNFRHIGAMAQDFYAAFGVGENDKTITTVDPDGVSFAAIQGLNEKLEEQTENLKKENETLKERLERQQMTIDALKKIVCEIKSGADICKSN